MKDTLVKGPLHLLPYLRIVTEVCSVPGESLHEAVKVTPELQLINYIRNHKMLEVAEVWNVWQEELQTGSGTSPREKGRERKSF